MRLTPMPCTLKEYRQEALTGGRYSNQCTGVPVYGCTALSSLAHGGVEDDFEIPMYCGP